MANPDSIKKLQNEDGTESQYYGTEVSENVPKMFVVCLSILLGMGITGTLITTRNPEYIKEEKVRMSVIPQMTS